MDQTLFARRVPRRCHRPRIQVQVILAADRNRSQRTLGSILMHLDAPVIHEPIVRTPSANRVADSCGHRRLGRYLSKVSSNHWRSSCGSGLVRNGRCRCRCRHRSAGGLPRMPASVANGRPIHTSASCASLPGVRCWRPLMSHILRLTRLKQAASSTRSPSYSVWNPANASACNMRRRAAWPTQSPNFMRRRCAVSGQPIHLAQAPEA